MKLITAFFLLSSLLFFADVLPDWPVWHNVGPGGGGWIQSILADRQRSDVLYVGCDVGGFYRSDDGGKTYTTHNQGLQDYFVETIAQHPTQHDILFLGCCSGLYKSTNGGRTWSWKRHGMPVIAASAWSAPISAIQFAPDNPNIIYAACGNPRNNKGLHLGDIYKSTDCGETWQQIVAHAQLPQACNIISLVIDPSQKGRLLISTNHGIFISTDDGVHWNASNHGLPAHLRTRRLVMSSSHPHILYVTVSTVSGDSPWQGGVYRSDDGGRSWSPRNNGLPQRNAKKGQAYQLNTNVDRIVIHPHNPDIVYTGGSAWISATVFKSVDGGQNWQTTCKRYDSSYDSGWITFWGPSVTCLTLSPANPDMLYFGTSGHVIKTVNAAQTWTQSYHQSYADGTFSGRGMEVTCLHSLTLNPFKQDHLLACFFDIGLLSSPNAGQSFRRQLQGVPNQVSNSCFKLVFDPLGNGQTCWGVFGNWSNHSGLLMVSEDAGISWNRLPEHATGLSQEFPENLTVIAINGTTHCLITQASKGILVSTDYGKTWQPRNNGLPSRPVRLLATHPVIQQTMVCFYSAAKDTPPQCYLSSDAGLSWYCQGPLPSSDLKQAVIAPNGTIYLTSRQDRIYPGGLFASKDNGHSWSCLKSDRFAQAIALDPHNPQRLAVGFNDHPYHDQCKASGIYLSNDSGTTWYSLNSATLHNTNATSLVFDPLVRDRLWLGTGGNAIFYTTLSQQQP